MSEIVYDSKLGNIELVNNLGLTLSGTSPRIKHTGTGTVTFSSPSGGIDITANGVININSSDTVDGIYIGSNTVPVTIGAGGGEITLGSGSSLSTFVGNVIIAGNLTVTGDTVSQEVTVIQTEDPILQLNEGLTNSDTNTADIGFVGNRGNANNIGFFWDESADEFVCALFSDDGDLSTTTVSPITDYANLRCGALTVDDNMNVAGTLTVVYRVDVLGDLIVGDDLSLNSDLAVLNFGADSEVNLTHVHNTGLLLNSNMQLQFRDSAIHLSSGTDGHLNIQADSGININIGGTSKLATTSSTSTFGTNIVIPNAGSIGSVGDTDALTISSGGVVNVTAVTASTSATTGALTVGGGMGVALDLFVGDDISLMSDLAVLNFGADSEVNLTHIHNTGLRLNESRQFQFRDATIHLSSPTDGYLNVQADIGVDINVNGTNQLAITGSSATFGTNIVIPNAGSIGSVGDTDALTISSGGVVRVTALTNSTSSTTGALTVAGGVGVAGNVFVGRDLSLASDSAILNFGATSDINLTTIGGIGIKLNNNKQFQFRDENIHISSVTDGYMNLQADLGVHTNIAGTVRLSVTDSRATFGTNIVIPNAGLIGSVGALDALIISSGGVVTVNATTASTSTSTGALVVRGGMGIATDMFIGDDLSLISDDAVLNFGADSDVRLTHVADTGLTLNDNMKLLFRDSAIHVSSVTDGFLNLQADSGVHTNIGGTVRLAVTSSTATFGTNIVIPNAGSIGSVGDTDALTISSGGVVRVTALTNSTSSTTGALTVAGGVGVAGNVFVGRDLSLASDSAILNFGATSDINLTTIGGIGIKLNNNKQFQFRDENIHISSVTDGYMNLQADLGVHTNIAGTVRLSVTDSRATFGTNIVIPNAGLIGSVGALDALIISSGGVVTVNATTASTSTSTGALVVRGGMGIATDMFIGDDLSLISDDAVLNFGADSDVRLTHVADTGLLLNDNMKLLFRDSAIHISSLTDGHLNVQADQGVNINIGGTSELAVTSTVATFGTSIVVNSDTANSPGSGFDTGAVTSGRISNINGEYVTTIYISLGNPIVSSAVADDIIGENDAANAYITQITNAKNGVIYRGSMVCVQAPTVGDPDINLVAGTVGTDPEDGPVTSPTVLITAGGAWYVGKHVEFTTLAANIQNNYLYLTHAGTTAGTYGAGKFAIKLYGVDPNI